MIDFHSLMSRADDVGIGQQHAEPNFGLVLSEPAPSSEFMLTEQRAYLDIPDALRMPVFVEQDLETGAETFLNERHFRDLVGSLTPLTVYEALALTTAAAELAFEKHADAIAKAYAKATNR
ncbi:hypothetical protein [Bradyrhizobium genosp. P]|uniref:hypothetical protein n=1 Tax=Bradyrhizobium genosp. P TaxID=83641 RepID=UPI003CEB9BF6